VSDFRFIIAELSIKNVVQVQQNLQDEYDLGPRNPAMQFHFKLAQFLLRTQENGGSQI